MQLVDGRWCDSTITLEEGAQVRLDDVGVIWYRRPSTQHAPGTTPTESLTRFLNIETRWFLTGFWECVPRPMVNRPHAGHYASIKAVQLQTAARLGFTVPPTCMGNAPSGVRRLWSDTQGQLIVKGFEQALVQLEDGSERMLYANPVVAEDVADSASLRACPSIWQAYVPKQVEIRATVFGHAVLAAEIHSQRSPLSQHDWRRYDLERTPYLPHTLPTAIENLCIQLLHTFGLFYGAVDLILSPDGTYTFLELNPFGQWAWVQDLCGLPLAEAHCQLFRLLIDGTFCYAC
jgi:glutathione synthase/RimK-type ligase-like ATP-grasp enzyme